MENSNCISFRLKSKNNEYLIKIKLLDNEEPQKLEISLIHILKTGNISFLLQKSKEELINENKFLSEFNSIKEIFDYFVKIIKSHNMQIIKPNSHFIFSYYIEFFDKEKHLSIPILLPRETSPTKKSKKKIEKIEKEKLINKINKPSKPHDDDKKLLGAGEIVNKSVLSYEEQSSTNIIDEEKNILKDNNKSSLKNRLINFNNEKIVSDEKDECENFTAFINMNKDSFIVWTVKGKGIINIYDFKKNLKTKKEAHNDDINSIQYFHDNNGSIDYIISLSKLDDNIIKIWKLEYENDNNLLLMKSFENIFFKRELEIFCIFNNKEYNAKNSFLFIYGISLLIHKINDQDVNYDKNKEIICYKLDKDLNNVILGKDENNNDINYNSINNFYKVNYLDTYYDTNEKQLYLINCNEDNTEIIFNLFDNYIGYPFKYKDWNYYHRAFIKEINNVLKLFQLSTNSIVIWDIKKNEVEAFKYFDDICLFDFIFWNSDHLITLSDKKIITLKISGENIEIEDEKDKEKGFSRIKKINSPENSEFIIIIENHKVKYWSS